jgi:hypothetical protein
MFYLVLTVIAPELGFGILPKMRRTAGGILK